MSKYSDTIYALSTPPGKSAIAVIRVSGKKVLKIFKQITKKSKITPNKTNLVFLKNKDALIDQVLVIYFKSPNSFTGEDVLEINCHGGLAVIDKIYKTLEDVGARLAEPGEFTKRALLNNKIDLVKTESISDIINAETEKQRELAIKNISGGLSEFTTEINKKITTNLANLETLIDFSDEDLPKNVLRKIKEQNKNIIKDISKEIKTAEASKPIREGVRIGIVGKPNTGNVSQQMRNDVSGKGYPMPDGTYKVHSFDEHGPLGAGLKGLGDWSAYIGSGDGRMGKRTGMMIHSDIDPYGTLGCIGVDFGGEPGTQAEKNFLKSWNKANP